MKHAFFSTLLSAVLLLPGAATVSAAPAVAHRVFGGRGVAAAPMRARATTAPVTGHAVPRPDVGHVYLPSRVIVPAYGFYGPAFGWGYYGYDPLWYGWGGPYAYRYVVPAGVITGGLRIEVQPKNAQVLVDGYFAGVVDDFNGRFQHLNLTPGGHNIELHADGFQPLTFSTYIQPDHTTTYKGSMVPASESDR
jgi:hypothetical protein